MHSAEIPQSHVSHDPHGDMSLLDSLKDVHGANREAACVAIANLFQEPSQALDIRLEKLMLHGLCQNLISNVEDSSIMVRVHALGALRNLTIAGEFEFCEALISHHIIAALARVLGSCSVKELCSDEQPLRCVVEQVIILMTHLCEASSIAMTELIERNVLETFMHIVGYGTGGILMETLRCLMVLSENNEKLNEIFAERMDYCDKMLDLLRPEKSVSLYCRLLVIGSIVNISVLRESEENLDKYREFLEKGINFQAAHVIQQAQQVCMKWDISQKSIIEEECLDEKGILSDEEMREIKRAQALSRAWKDTVQIITFTLELIAQLTCNEDDYQRDWNSDDEEIMDQIANSETDMDTNTIASPSIVSFLIGERLLPQIRELLQNLVAIPIFAIENIRNDFGNIRMRLCNALTNILSIVSLKDMQGAEILDNLVTMYDSIIPTGEQGDDLESAITNAILAISRQGIGEIRHISHMLTRLETSASSECKIHLIAALTYKAQRASAEILPKLLPILLTHLQHRDLEIVAASLNAIFDLISDDVHNELVLSLSVMPALKEALKYSQSRFRAENSGMDRDTKDHIQETILNLKRFIQYKNQA